MEKQNPLTDRATWIRMLYMLLFAAVLQVLEVLLALGMVVQLLSKLFTGNTFDELSSLGGRLAAYVRNIVAFLTFHTDDLPFPFAPARNQAIHSGPADQTAS